MSTVIQIEKLSKQYYIQSQKKESSQSLKEVITHTVKNSFTRLFNSMSFQLRASNSSSEEFWALKDVSFEIKQGDRVGIIGRNAAGKSTLLKILSRITEPTTGQIRIKGRVASLLEVGTGFHPELTGRENIYLNGAVLGMSRNYINNKFDEIVAFAEVEKFLDTPVKHYSSGMYVRLAFAVAAHLESEILIVDEVLAVGDTQFQKKCLGKMEDISAKEGRTVLFVSHSMSAINNLCSRCLWLEKGKLISDADPHSVIREYLSSGQIESGLVERERDSKKVMNLRKVMIGTQEKANISDISYDQPVVIQIEYEINEPTSFSSVWLSLSTMEGIMVIQTADFDFHQDLLEKRDRGLYRTQLTIPEKWLNIGKYQMTVGVSKINPFIPYDRIENLVFNIMDISPSFAVVGGLRRTAILLPPINWRTQTVLH